MSTDTATPTPAMRRSASAYERLEGIRVKIREALDAEHRAEIVGDLARDLAAAEAEYLLWTQWGLMQTNGMTEEEATAESVKNVLREIVINGAGDTWSGRGNDMRRATFDGKRRFLDGLAVGL